MSNKEQEKQDKGLETIETTLTKSEQFIEKNQKVFMYVIGAIIVIVGLYWAFMKFYKQPREKEANSQMFVAQQSFEIDSFALALNGTVAYPGFIKIIEDYNGTKASNLAHYYAGVCYINLGKFDEAITYLKDFKTKDLLLSSEKNGLIGDAYVEKADYKSAVNYYLKATDKQFSNDFTTPIYLKKLGLVYEKLNQFEDAVKAYENIYYNYPKSSESKIIEKYIERAKLSK